MPVAAGDLVLSSHLLIRLNADIHSTQAASVDMPVGSRIFAVQ